MLINFWLEEVEAIDNHEIQSMITRDKKYALQILQKLADYDKKVYKYSITETESWILIQDEPDLPAYERNVIAYVPEIGKTGRVEPTMEVM